MPLDGRKDFVEVLKGLVRPSDDSQRSGTLGRWLACVSSYLCGAAAQPLCDFIVIVQPARLGVCPGASDRGLLGLTQCGSLRGHVD
jgi:hypothetical protein